MFVSQCWPGFSSLAVNCQVQSLDQAMMVVVVEEQSADVCGHGVCDDPTVSVPGSEVSDGGGEVQPAS